MQWGHFACPSCCQKRENTATELVLQSVWEFSSPGKQVARGSTPCWKRSQSLGYRKWMVAKISAAETPVLEIVKNKLSRLRVKYYWMYLTSNLPIILTWYLNTISDVPLLTAGILALKIPCSFFTLSNSLGVQRQTSNLSNPFSICVISSVPPTTSAPAFWAASTNASYRNTCTIHTTKFHQAQFHNDTPFWRL